MIRRWTDPRDGKKWEVWISGQPGMRVTPGPKPGGPVPPGHIHFRGETDGYTDAELQELLDQAREE